MGQDDLLSSTALELARAIRDKQVSPLEALEASLARVDELNPELNAVIWRDDDEARAAAREAGEKIARSAPDELPPFHGVPIPVKDLTPVAGWPLTYGSNGAPGGVSDRSELVVEAFRRAGFVLACRTNTPEFGAIPATENLRYGITRNPRVIERTPGGSSGGAGAAVASGMFSVAHGNDGGGSIRIPASCCGLVGLKPSRGRVPASAISWGGMAVEGVLTKDVADAAAILDVISGPEATQWYNAAPPSRPFLSEVGTDPGHLRVGLVEDAPLGMPLDAQCRAAAEEAASALENLGHEVIPVSGLFPMEMIGPFLNVVNAALAAYEGIDWAKTEPHTQAARAAASEVDSLAYVASMQELQRTSRDLVGRFVDGPGRLDVLVSPTLTIPPPLAGQVLAEVHSSAGGGAPPMSVFQMAALTSPFNVTGQPAISLPTHTGADGAPIGVQFVAGPWGESLLIRLASQLEGQRMLVGV